MIETFDHEDWTLSCERKGSARSTNRSTISASVHRRAAALLIVAACAVAFSAPAAAGEAPPPHSADTRLNGDFESEMGAASAPANATAFVPVGPVRVVDTRSGAALGQGATLTVQITGPAGVLGVPAGSTAVAVNIAATETAAPGFFTVWGDGPQPLASALNVDAVNQTRANFVIAPIGADGAIRIFTQNGAHLVVDVSGAFTPSSQATAGRMVPLGPARALDTRDTRTPFAAAEERQISLARAGVPADATAVVVAITGLGAPGWWSAYAPGTLWPGTSVVNVANALDPSTSLAIIPVSDAAMTVKTLNGGELIVDVSGYITGTTAASSTDGLFVPAAPERILDTRGAPGPVGRLTAEAVVNPAFYPFDRGSIAALAANVTAVDPSAPGYLTAFPTSTERPLVAATNYAPGQTLATFAITPGSTSGVSLFTLSATHVVVDTTGYFLGGPSATTIAAPDTRYALIYPATGMETLGRWDPCTTIAVTVNYATAPGGTRELVAAALADLTAATGFRFTVADTDSHTASGTVAAPGILIHFQSPAEYAPFQYPQLMGVGIGTGTMFPNPWGWTRMLYQGEIIIRNDFPFSPTMGGRLALGDLLLHELAHVAGLDHVEDASQVMNPVMMIGHGSYQAGDLAGLAFVGAGNGCIDRPR